MENQTGHGKPRRTLSQASVYSLGPVGSPKYPFKIACYLFKIADSPCLDLLGVLYFIYFSMLACMLITLYGFLLLASCQLVVAVVE
jgi:hypothetical protein